MIKIKAQCIKVFKTLGIYCMVGLSFSLTGCEGFKLTGSMCETLQPGEVSAECRAYKEEEAAKASEHRVDDSGECLKCKKVEKIEIRR